MINDVVHAHEVEDFKGYVSRIEEFVFVLHKHITRQAKVCAQISTCAEDVVVTLLIGNSVGQASGEVKIQHNLILFMIRHFVEEEEGNTYALIGRTRNVSRILRNGIYSDIVQGISVVNRVAVAVQINVVRVVVNVLHGLQIRHAEPRLNALNEFSIHHNIGSISISFRTVHCEVTLTNILQFVWNNVVHLFEVQFGY